jgi:hypothetical protein
MEECNYDKKYSPVQLRRFKCFETTSIISLSRPFEQSRGGTTLSLKAIGVKLSAEERALLNRVMEVRRRIVAHSDEEEMHFLARTIPVLEGTQNLPNIQYDESLNLYAHEIAPLEALLHKLLYAIAEFIYHLAQAEPERLSFYRKPPSIGNAHDDGS